MYLLIKSTDIQDKICPNILRKMMKSQNPLTQNILVQENDWSKNNHKIILKKKLHNFNFLAIKY